jgi:hypothetical protein
MIEEIMVRNLKKLERKTMGIISKKAMFTLMFFLSMNIHTKGQDRPYEIKVEFLKGNSEKLSFSVLLNSEEKGLELTDSNILLIPFSDDMIRDTLIVRYGKDGKRGKYEWRSSLSFIETMLISEKWRIEIRKHSYCYRDKSGKKVRIKKPPLIEIMAGGMSLSCYKPDVRSMPKSEKEKE